jgi:hypothetical protein
MASVDSSNAAALVCDTALSGPSLQCGVAGLSGTSACIVARPTVSYSSSPVLLRFDALGQPVGVTQAQLFQVALAGVAIGKLATVEAVTGYVHD